MLISLAGHTLAGFKVNKIHSRRESETYYETTCTDCGVEQTQPGSRLTLGSAKCKSEYHDRAISNKLCIETKKQLFAEAEDARRAASGRAEQERAARIAQEREELAAQYRELVNWLLRNASPENQDLFFSQVSLRHWVETNEQNRALIVQLFKKPKEE